MFEIPKVHTIIKFIELEELFLLAEMIKEYPETHLEKLHTRQSSTVLTFMHKIKQALHDHAKLGR